LQEKTFKCSCFVGHDSADFIIGYKNSRKNKQVQAVKKIVLLRVMQVGKGSARHFNDFRCQTLLHHNNLVDKV
jgi:hypothetical protein